MAEGVTVEMAGITAIYGDDGGVLQVVSTYLCFVVAENVGT